MQAIMTREEIDPPLANRSGCRFPEATKPAAVTNDEFIRTIFGDEWPKAYVAAVAGGNWSNGGAAGTYLRQAGVMGVDSYYVVSTIPDGIRRLPHVEEIFILGFDDIGTKYSAEDVLALMGEPTYKIETSPGNFQWGYRYKTPLGRDKFKLHAAVFKELIARNLTDKIGDATRLLRLPVGFNMKPKHRREDGSQPAVRLVHWDPDRAVDIEELCRKLGIDPATVEDNVSLAGVKATASLVNPDHWIKAMQQLGMVKGRGSGEGKVDIFCPWEGDHTGKEDSGTAYLGGLGNFKCHHSHCVDKKSVEFKQAILDRLEEDDGGPNTGLGVMAGIVFGDDPLDELEIAAATERAQPDPFDPADIRGGAVVQALRYIEQAGGEFWRTPDDRPFVSLDGRHHALDTRTGCDRITGLLHTHGPRLNKNQRGEFIDDLRSRAKASDEVHEAPVRIARDGSDIIVDHGQGVAVRIEPGKWSVVRTKDVKPRFDEPRGFQPQVTPAAKAGGASWIDCVGSHLNLPAVTTAGSPDDAGIQALAAIIVFVAAAYHSKGVRPILRIDGPAGSGKTVAGRRIHQLVDNHAAPVATMPKQPKDLALIAGTTYAPVLDNISSITGEMSDALCTAASGAAFQTRELYTDREMAIFYMRASIILTGIAISGEGRSDLVDRCLTLELSPPQRRRSEAELDEAWEKVRPTILGRLYDALAQSLLLLPQVVSCTNAAQLPRIADAVLAGEALARASGWPPDLLIDAIVAQRKAQSEDKMDNDPLAIRLEGLLVKAKGDLTMTPTELLAAIQLENGPSWGMGGVIQSTKRLRIDLDRLATDAAKSRGWEIKHVRKPGGNRARVVHITAPPEALAARGIAMSEEDVPF